MLWIYNVISKTWDSKVAGITPTTTVSIKNNVFTMCCVPNCRLMTQPRFLWILISRIAAALTFATPSIDMRGSPWESLHGLCSRLNRRTGQMGALMYCKTKHLFGFGGGGGDAALFVGSLPLTFCFCYCFFGSLPWSFISVISRAGGEVAPTNSRQTGLHFCFLSTFNCSSILS